MKTPPRTSYVISTGLAALFAEGAAAAAEDYEEGFLRDFEGCAPWVMGYKIAVGGFAKFLSKGHLARLFKEGESK